jgi:UDP-N-acetylglucosamine:LPS N-acetylglucosamine transferase
MAKLLILSSDTGEGHNSAAAAIFASAQEAGLDASIRKPLEESGSFNRAFGDFYNLLLTRKPQWMTKYLWLIDRIRPNERNFMYKRVRRFMGMFLDSEKAGVILSVHPMLNHFLPRFIKEERTGHSFHTFVTDPFPPFWRGWASPFVDRYFVVREEAVRALANLGVEPSKIEQVPMPVRPQFAPAAATDVQRVREELRFDDSPIILINGGARGGGPIQKIYETVRRTSPGSNIIAICGRNSTLQRQIESIRDLKTRTFGFVGDIHRYISTSNLVLTKPGAMTTYETLACGVPIVLLGILALMPQESGMFVAARRYDFGYSVSTFSELEHTIGLGPREWDSKTKAVHAFYRTSGGGSGETRESLIERIQPVHASI